MWLILPAECEACGEYSSPPVQMLGAKTLTVPFGKCSALQNTSHNIAFHPHSNPVKEIIQILHMNLASPTP